MFIRKFSLLALTILFSISNLITGQNADFNSFQDVQLKINEMESSEDYSGAIEFINSIRNDFPEKEFEVLLETAYCYYQLGKYDTCMDVWEEGHSKGLFFYFRPTSPMYDKLKENERFLKIREADNKLRAAAMENSETLYKVKLPENFSSDKQHPVLIVFHGGGRNMESPAPFWTCETLNNNFIIIYMQSYFHLGSNTFTWRNHDVKAEEDIGRIFYELAAEYPVDTSNVYIGGISAGGSVAFDLGLINPVIPIKSIIAICPAIAPRDFTTGQIEAFKQSGTELHIITGEKDWGLERQKGVMKMMDDAGAKYNVSIIPGMGHEYPDDLSEHLQKILTAK